MSYPVQNMSSAATQHDLTSSDFLTSIDLTRIGRLAEISIQHQNLFEREQSSKLFNDALKVENHLIITTLTSPPPIKISSYVAGGCPSKGWGDIFGLIEADIPEDSIYRKILACIPIIGIIPTVINERSLRVKITQTKNIDYAVRLINIKNHYKISSVIRKLLSIALIVTGVARAILSCPTGIGAGFIAAGCVAFYLYEIYKNKQIINELKATGIPSSGIHVR